MLALVMLWVATWLVTIPHRLSLVLGEDDPPLTEEESHWYQEQLSRFEKFSAVSQPWHFYVLCLSFVHIDPGSRMANGLAWAHAVFWLAARCMESTSNQRLRGGLGFATGISWFALAIYAGVLVTRDLLVMSG